MNSVERRTAGMIGRGTETFTFEDQPYTRYKSITYPYETTPSSRKAIYKAHMKAHPVGEKAMEGITGSTDDDVKLKQWMMCWFGGMDDTPDIDENDVVQEAEYVPCEKRGICKFEGIGCCTVEVSHGVFLSKAELAVVRLCFLPDKLIADELGISTETVKNQNASSRKKIGLNSSKELVWWAAIKGII